jgi:hypothetical protein
MITSKQCQERYGVPELEKAMQLWHVPETLQIATIPKRIYCNKDLVEPLHEALHNIRERDRGVLVKSWDGCFNIRRKRGAASMSLHSWGVAIDINAAWNRFGQKSTMPMALVKCFTDAGFEWGGYWSVPDGMHFQLAEFPAVS